MMRRTGPQNRAMHKFFQILSENLNAAGLDQRIVLKPSIPIEWDAKAIKKKLWKPLQKAVLHKESTTELEKIGEIEKVHETLMRHLGQTFHVEFIPFPSRADWHEDKAPMKELSPSKPWRRTKGVIQ